VIPDHEAKLGDFLELGLRWPKFLIVAGTWGFERQSSRLGRRTGPELQGSQVPDLVKPWKGLRHRLERKRNSLATPNAKRDGAFFCAVANHGMQ